MSASDTSTHSPEHGSRAATGTAVPAVVRWYARYCQFAVALFAAASLVGVRVIGTRAALAEQWGIDPTAVGMFGGLWILTLLFLAFVHFAALRTPATPWAWKIHAIVLAIGLTTLVLWPVALPLIWYWLKPETKAFFGVPTRPTG